MGVKAEILGFGATGSVELGRDVEIVHTGNGGAQKYEYWYMLDDGKGWISCNKIINLPIQTTCEAYPDSERVYVSLCVRTIENGKNIGDSYGNSSMGIPSNVMPSASLSNISDINPETSGAGEFLLGRSKLQATVSESGMYGSTIKSHSVTINGVSTNIENGKIETDCNSKTLNIELVVTDTRNRTAIDKKTITVYEYSEPFIWEYKVYRCTSTGKADESGDYFCCEFLPNAALYPGNKLNYKIEEQKLGDTGWRHCKTVTNLNQWGTIKEVLSVEPDFTHTIKLTLYDKVSKVFYTRTLLSTSSVMDIKADGTGISFGRSCETSGFTCAFPSVFTKNTTIQGQLSLNHGRGNLKNVAQEIYDLNDSKKARFCLADGIRNEAADDFGEIKFDGEGSYRNIGYIMYCTNHPAFAEFTSFNTPNSKHAKPIFYFAWFQRNSGHESFMLPWTDGTRHTFIDGIDENNIRIKNTGTPPANWSGCKLYVVIFYYN